MWITACLNGVMVLVKQFQKKKKKKKKKERNKKQLSNLTKWSKAAKKSHHLCPNRLNIKLDYIMQMSLNEIICNFSFEKLE